MNVLFIGPYRQQDGWGEASRSIILSLMTTPVNLVIRPIYLAQGMLYDIPESMRVLEQKQLESYDIIIQHTLPEFTYYRNGVKNICFCMLETNNLKYTPWINHLKLMDDIWVSSKKEYLTLIRDGVSYDKILPIYEATDTTQFVEKAHDEKRPFTFYFIGEFNQRKNLESLLLAFHREFGRDENVGLTIKTNGINDQQLIEWITQLKQKWQLYKNHNQYINEKIITNFLSESELQKLHQSCDCFVMPSHGEAWCRPALDAMGFGNTPIVTTNTGMDSFINNDNGWLVKSYEVPAVVDAKPIEYLYTARETWQQIDILELSRAMREAYTNKELRLSKSKKGQEDVLKYSYENIGKRLYNMGMNNQ